MSAIIPRPGALLASQLDYILVDGSGSMQPKWWEFMATLDNFMNTLRAMNVNSHGIVNVFDHNSLEMIQRNSLISEWKTFSEDPLGSNFGGTPLYDAINLMGRTLRDLDPDRCSIVIVTDGQESDSTHTTVDQARAILDWCRAKGWQVTFLGCDFDNTTQAKLLGATEHNALGVRKELLAESGRLLADKRIRYGASGDDIDFTDDERTKFGGYLSGPSNDSGA